MKPNLGEILRWVVGGIITCLLLFALFATSGCAAKKPTVAPQVHTETNDSTEKHHKQDSVFIDRWHTEWLKGDTVYIHDSIYFYVGNKETHDKNVRKNSADTVPQIVEKELSMQLTRLLV